MSVTDTADFRALAERVQRLEREHAARQGDQRAPSSPRPGVSPEALAEVEAKLERKLQPDYAAFLRVFDGWPLFAWGTSLFGTEDLLSADFTDASESLAEDDDRPQEVDAGLIIGASQNDASLVILLESGEVVEWLYEESQRHGSLAAYIESRATTLEQIAESAAKVRRATEAQWSPAFRAAADAALEAELRVVMRESQREAPERALAPPAGDLPAQVTPDTLLLRAKDGDLLAEVGLGLVVYLGAAPTKEEVLATFRAFRKHFPARGRYAWKLASSHAYGVEYTGDLDAEPFAAALVVDDAGHFGLRVQIDETTSPSGRKHSWFLNVRGVPADDNGPRASFVELFAPPHASADALAAFARDVLELLPVRSGHGGYFAHTWRTRDAVPDPNRAVFAWCRRFLAVDVLTVDGWLSSAVRRLRGAGWLTLLGTPFARVLDDATLLAFDDASITRHDGKYGVLFTAGALTLGDQARGEFPRASASVAHATAPLALGQYARRGSFSVGGVQFSTFASEVPAFADHAATGAHLRRFTHPAAFLGSTARERAVALLERLAAATSDGTAQSEWAAAEKSGEDHFRTLLRLLYNAAVRASGSPLAAEALELVVRYPDDAPASAYYALLHAYISTKQYDSGLAIMSEAMHAAKQHVATYHNAACIYALAGYPERALECMKLAKAGGYQAFASMKDDSDLASIAGRDEFKALFSAVAAS